MVDGARRLHQRLSLFITPSSVVSRIWYSDKWSTAAHVSRPLTLAPCRRYLPAMMRGHDARLSWFHDVGAPEACLLIRRRTPSAYVMCFGDCFAYCRRDSTLESMISARLVLSKHFQRQLSSIGWRSTRGPPRADVDISRCASHGRSSKYKVSFTRPRRHDARCRSPEIARLMTCQMICLSIA